MKNSSQANAPLAHVLSTTIYLTTFMYSGYVNEDDAKFGYLADTAVISRVYPSVSQQI